MATTMRTAAASGACGPRLLSLAPRARAIAPQQQPSQRRGVAAWSQTDQQTPIPATEERMAAPAEQQEQPAQVYSPYPPPPYSYGPPPGADASTAVYPPGAPPGYYQQARPGGQEAYYGYYAMPPPPPPNYKQESSSGTPWWIWVGVGVIATSVFNKVQEFMRNPKTPQQMMAEMAMKQMMSSMGQGSSSAGPFGKAGAAPPFPFPSPPGGFGAPPFPPPSPAATSTVDVSASSSSGIEGTGSGGPRKGEKFASRLSGASPAPSTTPASSPAAAPGSGAVDVVEPIVKEPGSGSGSATSRGSPSSRSSASFFAQASTPPSTSTSSSSGANGAGAAGGAASTSAESSAMVEMMETMLRNPEMQKMLYPYMPEPMRNPESIEWMLKTPEVKKQMAAMFEQQNTFSPQMLDMMKGMDLSQDKVNQQFEQLGLKPEDVITKVMANPSLAAGFQNPKVQMAIMEVSQNPISIMKYQNDPEVMKVLTEVTTLFQPNVPPGQR